MTGEFLYVGIFGAVWSYLALRAGIWRYLELSGSIWSYLAHVQVSDANWSYAIWRYLELSRPIWTYLDLSGAIYIHMLTSIIYIYIHYMLSIMCLHIRVFVSGISTSSPFICMFSISYDYMLFYCYCICHNFYIPLLNFNDLRSSAPSSPALRLILVRQLL